MGHYIYSITDFYASPYTMTTCYCHPCFVSDPSLPMCSASPCENNEPYWKITEGSLRPAHALSILNPDHSKYTYPSIQLAKYIAVCVFTTYEESSKTVNRQNRIKGKQKQWERGRNMNGEKLRFYCKRHRAFQSHWLQYCV